MTIRSGSTKRVLSTVLAVLLCFTFVFSGSLTAYAAESIVITTAEQLDTVVRNNLSGNYILGADIDLSGYAYTKDTWTAKKGWEGIGKSLAKAFTGTFDGNGYTISGLWSEDRSSNQGLFRWLKGATIRDLTIELAPAGITGSGERKGALAGDAYDGTLINNCVVIGNGAPISGSANYIAGLVGVVKESEIRDSAAIDVNTSGHSYVAGFLGGAYGESVISGCYATGSANASDSYAGGFVGVTYEDTKVKYCYATGSASAKISYAGGFAGALYDGSTVEYSYSMGDAYTKHSYAGGFAGALYGGAYPGTLYNGGNSPSSIFRCGAFGDARSDLNYAGGLLGVFYDKSTVEESCAYGDVSSKGYCVGGLVGETNRGTIRNCYAQGDVSGTTGVGGLVGYFSAAYSGKYNTAENTYSSGEVTGKKDGVEKGAYSGLTTVQFDGTNYHDTDINPGMVATGTASRPGNVGGNSLPQSLGTVPMMKQETFEGWNFETIWTIDEDETYPYFWWWGAVVRYDANGGNGAHTDREFVFYNTTVDYDVISADEAGISLDDYRVVAWNTERDGSGTTYNVGDELELSMGDRVTLYAIWEYAGGAFGSVVYDANGGEGGKLVGGIVPGTQHTVLDLVDAGIERAVWTFTGWNTAADGSGTEYQPGDTIPVSSDIILYAQWEYGGALYTVVYLPGIGTGGHSDTDLMAGDIYTVKSGVEASVNYAPLRVVSWLGSDGNTYYPGDPITISDNLTLTAQWDL